MNTVFYNNFTEDRALINPTDTTKPIDGFPEVCISTFSKKIIDKAAALDNSEIITYLQTANGDTPIYKINHNGKEFAFYLSLVGAPASVSCLEEVIAMGAKKFIFFGCCGILDDAKVGHNLIIPTAAIRDEGTSYHYAPPSEEITPTPESITLLEKCFTKYNIPYTTGKIWTTDAIYRETLTTITQRKQSGCIAVEMEYSALLAAAHYRNIPFHQFLYPADSLDNNQWKINDLTDYGHSNAENYFTLALHCAHTLSTCSF